MKNRNLFLEAETQRNFLGLMKLGSLSSKAVETIFFGSTDSDLGFEPCETEI